MADTFVVIEQEEEFVVTTQESSLTTALSDLSNPSIIESLDFVGEVDVITNGKVNGSVLVYNTTTNKWTATTTLNAQNMEGGEF
jgi:hypothetical protein